MGFQNESFLNEEFGPSLDFKTNERMKGYARTFLLKIEK